MHLFNITVERDTAKDNIYIDEIASKKALYSESGTDLPVNVKPEIFNTDISVASNCGISVSSVASESGVKWDSEIRTDSDTAKETVLNTNDVSNTVSNTVSKRDHHETKDLILPGQPVKWRQGDVAGFIDFETNIDHVTRSTRNLPDIQPKSPVSSPYNLKTFSDILTVVPENNKKMLKGTKKSEKITN